MNQPILFFDLETTGVDICKDRIISIAACKVTDFDFPGETLHWLLYPNQAIPAEATAVHGITNDMVKDQPEFYLIAPGIHAYFKGCNLAGFNLLDFDIPLLWEEFHRAGINWQVPEHIIDASNIFRKKEPRTLSAAVQFYCGRAHDGAHNACADVEATIEVVAAQIARYPDLQGMDIPALAQFSTYNKRVDLAGKLGRDEHGHLIYNFGKSKGKRVKDDPGFARWMLREDFPAHTKMILQTYLKGISI